MVLTQKGSVLYVYTKFQADSSFHSNVIRGSQNFEIWSRDPGHAHLGWFYIPYAGGAVLHHCTKFEADSSFRSKVINGSQNLEIRSADPATPI